LPKRCVDALRELRQRQDQERAAAGSRWHYSGLVFTSRYGTPLSPENVRRDFRRAIKNAAGVDARQWTPRELRHSFVSLLSDSGIPVEEISRLVGHKSTVVTELVYRKQIRPVLQSGAETMDRIFGSGERLWRECVVTQIVTQHVRWADATSAITAMTLRIRG